MPSAPRMGRSIFVKLALLFLIFIGGLLAATVFMNASGARSIEREIRRSVESRIEFYLTDIEQELSQVEDLEGQYVIDRDLALLSIDASAMTAFERVDAIRSLRQRLAILEASSNYVDRSFISIPALDRTVFVNDFVSGIDAELYSALERPSTGSRLVGYEGNLYVAASFPPPAAQVAGSLYLIASRISLDHLRLVLDQILGPYAGRASFVIDGEQIRHERELDDANTERLLGSELVGFERRSGVYPLRIEVELPYGEIFGAIGPYRRWFWLSLGVAVIAVVAFAVLSFRIVHRPLHALLEAFGDVEGARLDTRLTENRHDEFTYIYRAFNRMTGRLEELVHSVYEKEILRQRSELKRLQSQINPHFLYNNFYLLYRMIKSSRSEEAATLADYMGRYFQFITRDTQNEESLEREVAHAQTYTNIQSLAYGNRIQVSFPDPPAEAAEMQVPRLVLQPLLENAFEHALESKRRDAALSVGYRIIGRSLEIDVADNGEELSDEALDELNRRLSELESGEPARIVDQTSGLLNVHRRLVLRFGPRAGIKLYRSSQGGLLVRLSLPLADAPTRPLVQDAKL